MITTHTLYNRDEATTPTRLFAPIEPFASGMLEVGDGHSIYWEMCGNPEGKPALFLHGGPGGGCSPTHRRLFDPMKYCVLLFDQRGCGRSVPHAGLDANTTWDLVADIEKLRLMAKVEKWLVFGGSWGSTLALAYAETHPAHVSAMVLRGIFLMRQSELNWYYQDGASRIFPDLWSSFIAPIAEEDRHDYVSAYHRLLTGSDAAKKQKAANAWTNWENATVRLRPENLPPRSAESDRHALAFARIENHYFFNRGFMQEGQLLADVHKIRHIPCTIVQGRYDVVTPMASAWDLHVAWPESELHVVTEAGHAFSENGILRLLLQANQIMYDRI